MLRYYMGVQNPGKLPDESWAKLFEVLQFIRKEESKKPVP
jgi:hypothetical protein